MKEYERIDPYYSESEILVTSAKSDEYKSETSVTENAGPFQAFFTSRVCDWLDRPSA